MWLYSFDWIVLLIDCVMPVGLMSTLITSPIGGGGGGAPGCAGSCPEEGKRSPPVSLNILTINNMRCYLGASKNKHKEHSTRYTRFIYLLT